MDSQVKFQLLQIEEHGRCSVEDGAVDPDWFFPQSRGDLARAQGVCGTCVVRKNCLALAVTTGAWGVWGGELLSNGEPRSNIFRPDRALATTPGRINVPVELATAGTVPATT